MSALTPLALQNATLLRSLRDRDYVTVAGLARSLGRDVDNVRKTLKALEGASLVGRPDGETGAMHTLTDWGSEALAALDRADGLGGDFGLTAPHAAFKPHPLNPRKDFHSEDAKAYLDELSADIVARGQDHNIVVNPAGDDGLLVIRSGETRWRAIGLAIEHGLWPADRAIRYILREEDAQARLFGALGENIHRRALNPIEEGEAFRYARDQLGVDTAEIARRVGKTMRFVQLRMQILDAPPMVKLDLIAGRTTITKALETVQEKKAEPPSSAWEPTPAQALIMVEATMACDLAGEGRDAPFSRWPDSKASDLTALVHNAGVGYGANRIHIHETTLEILDRIGLNPRVDQGALFRARQRAGLANVTIKDLETAGRYHTDWLNVNDEDDLNPPAPAPAPAPKSDAFADQVRRAQAEVDADETQEMFPEAPRQDAPPATTMEAQSELNTTRNARCLMAAIAEPASEHLVAIELDGDFTWSAADCPQLAERMAFHFNRGDVLGVAGMAAALYDRGGDLFSERAMASAWRGAVAQAFAIPTGMRVNPQFEYTATGEIIDAEDRGLLASLEEGVSEEDGRAMALAPEMRTALLGLLAVRPSNWDDGDLDPETHAAWSYAQSLIALTEVRA